jgi:hypothetical protein
MTEQIFKLQRPLNCQGDILIYNKSRSIMAVLPWPKDKQDSFFLGKFKVYARGKFTGDDFEISEKVKDQNW